MNDRFKFRATFSVSYYDENGNDKDIKLTVYDVAVCSGGEIGFSAQQMETIINALKLPETEQDSVWQFINDNYATSSYEWFVCDNAIIEQCAGLKDKNGNLIYEGDLIKSPNNSHKLAIIRMENGVYACKECRFNGVWEMNLYDLIKHYGVEIIGNIHEQTEQKDVK